MLVVASSTATGKMYPPCTKIFPRFVPGRTKIQFADGSHSVRVGASGTESVPYPYVAVQRRVLHTTICHPYSDASRLPIGQHTSSSGSFNFFESKPVRPGCVKDTCGGGVARPDIFIDRAAAVATITA